MVQYSNLEEDWFVCTFVVLTRLFVMTRAQLYFSTSVDLSKSFHCLNEHFFAPSNLIILPMTLISAWTSHSLDVGGKTVKMWFLHPKTEINIVSLECRLEIRREKICHFRGFKTKAKKRGYIFLFFFFQLRRCMQHWLTLEAPTFLTFLCSKALPYDPVLGMWYHIFIRKIVTVILPNSLSTI